ncbi:hypothetical protein G9A89_014076 [Geosiphon pyriformis]|nr:hypothetical protein G9A89_014076 [Geosiphon pyriformis]
MKETSYVNLDNLVGDKMIDNTTSKKTYTYIKINSQLDQEVIIKKISMDLPKLAVKSVFSKFKKIASIKMQLIGLWQKALVKFELSEIADLVAAKWSVFMKKNSVYVAKAIDDKQLCAIVCFANEAFKLTAISFNPVFKSVNLHWAGFLLAHCAHCKQFGHISMECSLDGNFGVHHKRVCFMELFLDQISEILRKLSFVKLVPMSSLSCVLPSIVASSLDLALILDMTVDSMVMPSFPSLLVVENTTSKLSLSSSKVLTTKMGGLELKMMALEILFGFVSSSSTLMIDLIWKIAMCNIRRMNNPAKQSDIICWHKEMNNLISIIMNRFDNICVFISGVDSGYLDFGVAIIIDIFLAYHVCKVSEVPGQILSVKLLFKNKLSLSILGLYAGASLVVWFSQAGDINSLITKTVNKSSFIILGGNFNEDESHKCASFRKCFDLDLCNSYGIAKTIDYVFFSSNLVNTMVDHNMASVVDYFDIDYVAIFVSIITSRMESFELDKSYIIKSVLEHLFHKMVLDHLVVSDELILEPDLPLDHVFDGAFSGVMCPIGSNELFAVISNLPDGKAASFFGISNELWKHCDNSVLDMLFVLLNLCLTRELVSGP